MHNVVFSGLRHWIKFIEIVHGQDAAASVALPPRLDDVLAWSHTFRCVSIFELAYIALVIM